MIKSFSKLLLKNKKSLAISMKVPVYNFIFGRMFKKQKLQDIKQAQQNAKMQAQILEAQKKKMKRQVQEQNQYDFLQRQKDIELNKDFRKQQQKYKNTIPQDIGKAGFNQLVFWSQNAQTPQQIVDLIKKFNKCSRPKVIQDDQAYLQFLQNVKATVYLAQNYAAVVDYAHFGYKQQIMQPQFWLKIEQKVVRKPPRTEQQVSQLIDILFVMGNVGQGEVIFSSSERILSNLTFTVEQIAKLIIAFFKTSKGQKQWITRLLASLQLQMNEATCEVLQSILPILKQSKNIPYSFDEKLQKRLLEMQSQLPLSLVCIASEYFGFQKGSQQLWQRLQGITRRKMAELKNQKGRIPSSIMTQLVTGALSSYKFSTEFVADMIYPQIMAKDCRVLYRLNATVLSTLSKCLYIYQLQSKSQIIEETIQGLIMKHFQNISEVSNQDLVHVLKDYTVTRLGSRQFYLYLQRIVNDKLQDIRIQKYTVEALTAIYQQSNLCSTDTLELLKGMAYQ